MCIRDRYGRDARLPTETVLSQPTTPYQLDMQDYRTELVTHLSDAWSLAQQNITKAVHSVILHCLDRKGSSNKFTAEDIVDIDAQQGVFSVCSSKGKIYTVNFGTNSEDQTPNCTC